MSTFTVSIQQLDEDTAMVAVSGDAPGAAADELEHALQQAEASGKPALVIDLTGLREPSGPILSAVSACQRRCIVNGRWLLVVPPYPDGGSVPPPSTLGGA